MPLCNKTRTYFLPQNPSAFRLIPFGVVVTVSLSWLKQPRQQPQNDMPPPRNDESQKIAENAQLAIHCQPASQPASRPAKLKIYNLNLEISYLNFLGEKDMILLFFSGGFSRLDSILGCWRQTRMK